MEPTSRKPKDPGQLIDELIEVEASRHHLYHRQVRNFMSLLYFATRDKPAMGLQELKAIMYDHWKKYHEKDIPQITRFVFWVAHYTISKRRLKYRENNNLPEGDVTEGHSHTPLRNLNDINNYYAFAGVILMAIEEIDIATMMHCTVAKLGEILEKQISAFYSGRLSDRIRSVTG